MGIYIWLMIRNLVVHCATGVGCIQVGMSTFDHLVVIGAIEVVFEVAGIMKIYMKRSDNGNGN